MLQGCTSKLVVKFADTQKEKEQKKLQQMAQQMCYNNLLQMACLGGMNSGNQQGAINNPYLFVSIIAVFFLR